MGAKKDILYKIVLEIGMAKFYFFGNTTNVQMFGSAILTDNFSIIIDGGTPFDSDRDQLASFIKEKCGGVVDAWIFTHPHHDHLGAFCEICKTYPEIIIKKIYHHLPDLNLLKTHGSREDWEHKFWDEAYDLLFNKFSSITTRVQVGDKFVFDDVTITVLRTLNNEFLFDFVNNSCAVYRIDGPSKSVLILGDLAELGGEEMVKNCDLTLMQTDYTQMAHHGQRGVNKAFYDHIKPKRCIWPCPDWLYDNDRGLWESGVSTGKGTGPWWTLDTRKWMDDLGVCEHLVEKDGTQSFEI